MKTIISKSGVEIKVYASADELGIKRYIAFQKYAIQEASTERLLSKLERTKSFLELSDIESAKVELKNAISCLNLVFDGVGYYTYAFACLVSEIGGKTVQDISPTGLAITIAELEKLDITYGEIKEHNEDVKKKLKKNLN